MERGLVGEIVGRIERLGYRFERLELTSPGPEIFERHYPSDQGWLGTVGSKTLEDYERQGLDPVQQIGTADAVEIGTMVKGWLVEYMASGPVLVGVLRGNRCVEVVRKVVGATLPVLAAPGTIRGDLSVDSPDVANAERRPIRNLVHASGDVEEAEREIAVWFADG
ncbi:MAG: nucleoside-diphosphate kinase [Actinomycetota bacterium]|nr:nucleoside-diphosphate kinase [Actinomycetota bacterium]